MMIKMWEAVKAMNFKCIKIIRMKVEIKDYKNQYLSFFFLFSIFDSFWHPPSLHRQYIPTTTITHFSQQQATRWTRMGNENKLQNIEISPKKTNI
jgi:hypothetical protein